MKRTMDLLLAACALMLLSPLMLATALAVLLDSGRPVLFAQQRVGRGQRLFGMLKFRSMVIGAQAAGPWYTSEGDPRITRVGRFIRRTSLDELPQLLNVLKGDMSLVGPRPDLQVQRANYTEDQWALRCSVRPGITGLAQSELRSAATTEQRLALDLRYAREHNLWLDLCILARTALRLSGRGSN